MTSNRVSGKNRGPFKSAAAQSAESSQPNFCGGRRRDAIAVAGTGGSAAGNPLNSPSAGAASASASFRLGRIVYVHGAGRQPLPSELKRQWDVGLFQHELGDRSRMAYWAEPAGDASAGNAGGEGDSPPSGGERDGRSRASWQAVLDELLAAAGNDSSRQQFIRQMAADLGFSTSNPAAADIPPHFREVVQDSLRYFFDQEFRASAQQAVAERLSLGTPLAIVTHGLGGVICWDVLSRPESAGLDVRMWVSLGSLQGLSAIDERMRIAGNSSGPVAATPPCVARWLQVADDADRFARSNRSTPTAVAKSNRFEELRGGNVNREPANRHGLIGYLQNPDVGKRLREAVGDEIGQATGRFLVAKDLVNDIEDQPDDRHHVLIQLSEVDESGDLTKNADRVLNELHRVLGQQREAANIEILRRFIAADLTRWEIEAVSQTFENLRLARVWRDSEKSSLIYQSIRTLQARAAVVGYGATGHGIRWAVLDSGIAGEHPHFQECHNIVSQWDCTGTIELPDAPPVPGQPLKLPLTMNSDGNGHGTHVAGIIAGRGRRPAKSPPGEDQELTAMAPECSIDSYKVLDDFGHGRDSWIIKALDHISAINDAAGRLVIHGVNLSLGGPFDPSVYGCGHSPLCQELRRLWRQGVLVCVAVGNEGLAELQTTRGTMRANQDVTIIDPANLDECIAVGSVHKENPHTYGVSYFSSRGPTADGRTKPDVVAPGERILSANSRYQKESRSSDPYIERSGTSMAAPHVSGLLAAFLSVKREFIGEPDRVKEILASNCTSLNRDRCFQGHGLPNLVKMLVQT